MPNLSYAIPMPLVKQDLYELGLMRMWRFCNANKLQGPGSTLFSKEDWDFPYVCAYYRHFHNQPLGMIHICLDYCGRPASEYETRNWTWPGSTTDREPYGVLAHELGHHVDFSTSDRKGSYGGEFSESIRKQSGEPRLTSYCPNDWEWFAEMFRVFVTNHALLRLLRPKTWKLLNHYFEPVSDSVWEKELGSNVPDRILKNLQKKVREAR